MIVVKTFDENRPRRYPKGGSTLSVAQLGLDGGGMGEVAQIVHGDGTPVVTHTDIQGLSLGGVFDSGSNVGEKGDILLFSGCLSFYTRSSLTVPIPPMQYGTLS